MSSVLSTRVLLARLVSGSLLTEADDAGAEAPPRVGSPGSQPRPVLRAAAGRESSPRVVTTKLPPGVAQAVRRSEPARRARL